MKSQITNHKSQINSKSQILNPKTFWSFEFRPLDIVCNLVFGIWNFHFAPKERNGYAALITTLLVVTISLTVIGGFAFFALREVNVSRLFVRSVESRYISEGGMEDAVYRIITGKQIVSGETLVVGNGITTITITVSGTERLIRTEGVLQNVQQNLETGLDISVSGASFFYGVHVGDGGVQMSNNSRINGSVYSNGSILGSAGATITGDAFVAVAIPPAINQSWETQNADFNAGTAAGSIITIVDSAGNVGTYTSLALGSDRFARISYVDETNGDLKFVRCLDVACITKNISTVDSAGVIGEVTSLTLGSDGFGRISYYHDGNDDLKFVRCANADCSSAVVTLVDAASNMGDFSSVKMASDGFARIAYWDDSNQDAEYARCTNADCTTKVLTTVESSGNVGEYISLVLGSDDLARISYYDTSGDDLKFTRCTNANCTTKITTVVDSSGDVGKYTSLVSGSDGFARISYYDETNDDLKFVRCTNADCTSKNITTVDSSGTTGQHTSLALGSDGYPRISYYYSSSGDLRFARCTDADCAGKVITTVDSSSTVGQYTSLGLGAGDFGRISYYDSPNGNLNFVSCLDQNCSPQISQIDAGMSFQPTITDRLTEIQLYFKKVGSPANAVLRLVCDSSGSPSTNPADVLASSMINTAVIGSSYAWISFPLSPIPNLSANTTYWIVVDSSFDNSNYLVWGLDSAAGYTRGSPKRSADWTLGGWANITGDLNFRAYMGGTDTSLGDVAVGGNAHAHTIDNADVAGDVQAFSYNDGIVGGDIHASDISNCTVNGNAEFNTISSCTVLGSQTTPTTPPDDPARLDMPLPDSTLQAWKNDAASGGICGQPPYDAMGDYILTNGQSGTLGPKKINGKLKLDNNATLTLTGTLWVVGDIELSNGCTIRLSPGYGELSGIIITDGKIIISNNCTFQGSGDPKSFIIAISEKNSPTEEIITVDNNSAGVVYYADSGRIKFSNNATAKEATAYGMTLDNNAVITYDTGLQDLNFSSGPSGGYDVKYWKEVE